VRALLTVDILHEKAGYRGHGRGFGIETTLPYCYQAPGGVSRTLYNFYSFAGKKESQRADLRTADLLQLRVCCAYRTSDPLYTTLALWPAILDCDQGQGRYYLCGRSIEFMSSSLFAPSPSATRKRKAGCSDSIRSKGFRKHYGQCLCGHTTSRRWFEYWHWRV
jgi:hypothetical protein